MRICEICRDKFHAIGILGGRPIDLCSKHKHQVDRYGDVYKRTRYDKNEVREKDNYWEMDLYNKEQKVISLTIFDQEEKLEEVKRHKWCLVKKGKYGFYAKTDIRTNGKRKTLYLHDLLMDKKIENMQVDHRNGMTLDNRQANLRQVTQQVNLINKTRAKGYSWNKRLKKWETYIGFNNKRIRLGFFSTEEEAKRARLDAKQKYYSESLT